MGVGDGDCSQRLARLKFKTSSQVLAAIPAGRVLDPFAPLLLSLPHCSHSLGAARAIATAIGMALWVFKRAEEIDGAEDTKLKIPNKTPRPKPRLKENAFD